MSLATEHRLASPNAGATTTDRTPLATSVLCGTVALAWYLMGSGRSYVYDESVTIGFFVDAGWLEPFTSQRVANNHPLFSFLSQLVWRAGGTTETWMRLLPAAFAAASVTTIAWWGTKRYGVRSGLIAALVLGANPLFVHYARLARGYSLLLLCALASSILLQRLVEDSGEAGRRSRELAYVTFAAAGLATHLYMLLVLAAHLGLVLARSQWSLRWVIRWVAVGALAALAYVGSLPERRPGEFRPRFPLETTFEVLGGTVISAIVFGAILAAAARAHRADLLSALLPAGLFVVIWTVLTPFDLYPRFFVIAVPAVAFAAAWAVGRAPAAALPVLVAAAVSLPVGTPADSGIRSTASVLTDVVSDGGVACAVGSEALTAYLRDIPEFTPELDCDVIAAVGSWEPAGLRDARQTLNIARHIGQVEIFGT